MSTLRISNIEAKSVPASATVDEKVKITNSSGDTLVFIDGKTSGITTVGINTTDSNITFDANSNVVVTGIITATKFSGQFEPTSVGIADSIFHTGDTNTAIRFPANDTISFETSNNERLRITHNGRVGIGTDNPPDCTLTVCEFNSGTEIYDNIALRLQSSSGQNVALQFTDTTGAAAYIALQGDALRLGTNNIERIRIDSSGAAILKNTAAATPRSDFLGSLKPISQIASTWNAYHSLTRHDAGSSYGPYLMLAKNRNDAYNSNGIVQDNDELGNISFQGNDGSVFREGARIRGEVDGTPASNQMPSALTFWTNNGSGLSENMRVTSNGIIDAPAQAGFYARMQNTKSNVMGGGASYYTIPFDTDSGSVCYDTHNSYNTSNGLYTVPTHGTGHYIVSTAVCLSSSVYGRGGECWFVQGSYRYFFDRKYFTSTGGLITGFYGTINIKLTAGQTIGVQGFISGGSQDVDVLGAAATDQVTWFTARKIA